VVESAELEEIRIALRRSWFMAGNAGSVRVRGLRSRWME
jgi:hypothetical protein